jgi:hypothetical protein
MKKIIIFCAVAIFVCVLNGCKLIDKLTKFDVDYSTSIVIPQTVIPIQVLNINTPDITTNSEQTFSNNNTAADRIESVILKRLTLTITSPSGQKFDFLESAAVFISADGLSEIQVASISDIDDATVGSVIEMNPSGQDLKEYIKKSKIKLRVTTTTDKVISQDVHVKVDATFFVDAKVLGV